MERLVAGRLIHKCRVTRQFNTVALQAFVDSASTQQGFVSGNEYVLHVLQKEQDRDRLRALIEEAEASPSQEIDVASYIATLRHRFHTKKDL